MLILLYIRIAVMIAVLLPRATPWAMTKVLSGPAATVTVIDAARK
jgi:hypothetical protein